MPTKTKTIQPETPTTITEPVLRETVKEERKKKTERKEQSNFLIGCTLEERAYCVRLARLFRDENYWVADFVRQLLDLEARTKHIICIKKIREYWTTSTPWKHSWTTLRKLKVNGAAIRP